MAYSFFVILQGVPRENLDFFHFPPSEKNSLRKYLKKEYTYKSKKPLDKKGAPQVEKAPIQDFYSFKWSEIIVSGHVAFTFGDHGHFKDGRTRCKPNKIL